jgi:hypothetical protein
VLAALWFAALFGLGSLAISSAALGALVTVIGLPALVPAAAPPLGFTAHVLVALLLTMAGGGLGLVLGLRLRPRTAAAARPDAPAPLAYEDFNGGVKKMRARDAHPDAPPCRPLVLTEAFDQPAGPAAEEPAAPRLRRKPAQGGSEARASRPYQWMPFSTADETETLPPLDLGEAAGGYEAPPVVMPGAAALPKALTGDLPSAPVAEAAPGAGRAAAPVTLPAPVLEPAPPPTLLAATPQVPSGSTRLPSNREQLPAGGPWSPVATASLDSLGLVQLVERLALSIAARTAGSDAGPPHLTDSAGTEHAQPEVKDEPAPFAPRAAEPPSPETPRGDEPAGSARGSVMRRLGRIAAQDPGDAGAAPFSRPAMADAALPLRHFERPLAERLVQPASDRMVRPFAAPAIPAPAAADTDEALRAALATLHRLGNRG